MSSQKLKIFVRLLHPLICCHRPVSRNSMKMTTSEAPSEADSAMSQVNSFQIFRRRKVLRKISFPFLKVTFYGSITPSVMVICSHSLQQCHHLQLSEDTMWSDDKVMTVNIFSSTMFTWWQDDTVMTMRWKNSHCRCWNVVFLSKRMFFRMGEVMTKSQAGSSRDEKHRWAKDENWTRIRKRGINIWRKFLSYQKNLLGARFVLIPEKE